MRSATRRWSVRPAPATTAGPPTPVRPPRAARCLPAHGGTRRARAAPTAPRGHPANRLSAPAPAEPRAVHQGIDMRIRLCPAATHRWIRASFWLWLACAATPGWGDPASTCDPARATCIRPCSASDQALGRCRPGEGGGGAGGAGTCSPSPGGNPACGSGGPASQAGGDTRYHWRWPDGRTLVFGGGSGGGHPLQAIEAASGERLTLTYSPTGDLVRVRDPQGRHLHFIYPAAGDARRRMLLAVDT